MKRLLVALTLTLITLLLSACGGSGEPAASQSEEPAADNETEVEAEIVEEEAFKPLPDSALKPQGAAPEITNETWLNTDRPVTLESQRGKVVLLKFWTFGCINCKRVMPYVNEWYATYGGDDFNVLSVHYPEFSYEEDIDNVADALIQQNIEFPVAIDNDRVTWGAYNQRYWPTLYLIDQEGVIRYKKIGEGDYDVTERAIQTLIAEAGEGS